MTQFKWDAMHPYMSRIVILRKIKWTRHMLISREMLIVICKMHFVKMDTLILCIIGICLHQRNKLIKFILYLIYMYFHSKVFPSQLIQNSNGNVYISEKFQKSCWLLFGVMVCGVCQVLVRCIP